MANKVETITVTVNGVAVSIEGEMYHITKEQIADVFERFGGSFTQAIGVALYRADTVNTSKLLGAFVDMAKDFIEQFIDLKEL